MSPQALEKAKEASRKERTLVRQREQSDKADQINIDLYGSVSNTVRSIWFTFVNLIPSPVLIGSLSNSHSGTHIGHSSSILQAVVVVISSRLCYMICFLTFLPLITVSQRVPKCVHIPECLALLLQTWMNFSFFLTRFCERVYTISVSFLTRTTNSVTFRCCSTWPTSMKIMKCTQKLCRTTNS